MNLLKKFWQEEDGITTVEILMILAVLVIIALIFKNTIIDWVKKMVDGLLPNPDEMKKS